MPLGQVRSKFNFNLDEKRVLNMENIVNDADNVKQDMSIDVYGRTSAEDDVVAGPKADMQVPPSSRLRLVPCTSGACIHCCHGLLDVKVCQSRSSCSN